MSALKVHYADEAIIIETQGSFIIIRNTKEYNIALREKYEGIYQRYEAYLVLHEDNPPFTMKFGEETSHCPNRMVISLGKPGKMDEQTFTIPILPTFDPVRLLELF